MRNPHFTRWGTFAAVKKKKNQHHLHLPSQVMLQWNINQDGNYLEWLIEPTSKYKTLWSTKSFLVEKSLDRQESERWEANKGAGLSEKYCFCHTGCFSSSRSEEIRNVGSTHIKKVVRELCFAALLDGLVGKDQTLNYLDRGKVQTGTLLTFLDNLWDAGARNNGDEGPPFHVYPISQIKDISFKILDFGKILRNMSALGVGGGEYFQNETTKS